jgi:hypothetical protein
MSAPLSWKERDLRDLRWQAFYRAWKASGLGLSDFRRSWKPPSDSDLLEERRGRFEAIPARPPVVYPPPTGNTLVDTQNVMMAIRRSYGLAPPLPKPELRVVASNGAAR